jgi:hypothetical protein
MRTIAVALVVYWLATKAQPAPGTTLAWTLVPLRTPPLPEVAPPATIRPSCPLERTDAARLPADASLPHGVNQVAVSSTNAGWLAAWDERHVVVSVDAGRHFESVLDGPGDVQDVSFDCFGRIVVLRDGGRIGVREQGQERWQRIPGATSHGIVVGGGPDVVAVVADENQHGVLAVSADAGRTWWFRDLVPYWESALGAGQQHADGAIDVKVTTPDCDSYPTTAFHVRPDGKVTSKDLGYIESLRPMPVIDRAGRSWRIDETKDGEDAWLAGGR